MQIEDLTDQRIAFVRGLDAVQRFAVIALRATVQEEEMQRLRLGRAFGEGVGLNGRRQRLLVQNEHIGGKAKALADGGADRL